MNRVKQFRNEAGLTQRELAYELTMCDYGFFDQTMISHIENDKQGSNNLAYFIALANFFNTTIDHLVYNDEQN